MITSLALQSSYKGLVSADEAVTARPGTRKHAVSYCALVRGKLYWVKVQAI